MGLLILAIPLSIVYLVFFFFFPVIASIIITVLTILMAVYFWICHKITKFDDSALTSDEKNYLYRYPIYFRFYYGATNISAGLGALQFSTILMAIILVIKALWWYLIPISIVFIVCSMLRGNLDPLFFLKHEYARTKNQQKKNRKEAEINLLLTVYNKIYKPHLYSTTHEESRDQIDQKSDQPEEIQEALSLLGSFYSQHKSKAFYVVKNEIEEMILNEPMEFAHIIQRGKPIEEWIYSAISNIAGDHVESGEYHLYRGLLTPMGEDFLSIYDMALENLVRIAAISADKCIDQKQAIRENINDVG